MRVRTYYTFLLIGFLGTSFSVLHAQSGESINATASSSINTTINGGAAGISELQEQVSYTVMPERPNIGQSVEIKAEMYGTPVADAIFTWTIDGQSQKPEQGMNRFSFIVDQNTKVSVSILTVNGQRLYREWSFNPQNVVIIWEAKTNTPPFYKGKPLYTAESELVLNGINLDAKNPLTNTYANYTWRMDGKVKGADSGVGKNTFTYQGDILQQEPLFELLFSNVTSYAAVQARQANAAVSTRSELRVQTLESDIFTFEKTPLLGVLFNKKIPTNFLVTKGETSLVTYPMYFNNSFEPVYTWLLNDTVLKRNSNILTFRRSAENEKSRLTIEIQNPNSLLQSRNITHIIDTTTKSSSAAAGFGRE